MELRRTFNEDEYNYDKARPGYPTELFQDIFASASLDSNSQLMEIGIGTGQATLPFLKTGASLVAVELGENLAEFVQDKYKDYPNFSVAVADFMDVPVLENNYDLIYSATAFHWLPKPDSYLKVKQSLKEGGKIVLFWNHPFVSRDSDATNLANRAVYDYYRPSNKPQIEFSKKDTELIIKELEEAGFKNIQSKLYTRTRTLSTEQYLELLNTYSDHRALADELKTTFEKEMSKALQKVGNKINIYDTIDLYIAEK